MSVFRAAALHAISAKLQQIGANSLTFHLSDRNSTSQQVFYDCQSYYYYYE